MKNQIAREVTRFSLFIWLKSMALCIFSISVACIITGSENGEAILVAFLIFISAFIIGLIITLLPWILYTITVYNVVVRVDDLFQQKKLITYAGLALTTISVITFYSLLIALGFARITEVTGHLGYIMIFFLVVANICVGLCSWYQDTERLNSAYYLDNNFQ